MPNKLETPVKSPAGAAGETKAAETEEQVISKSLLSDKVSVCLFAFEPLPFPRCLH